MNLTNLSSADLVRIAKLLKKKETLLGRVAALDRQLSAFETGKPAVSKGRKPGKAAKRGGYGALKDKILSTMKGAGETSIPELARKLKVKTVNLHAWFGSTGKNVPGLKRVGRGKYKFEG